MNFTTEWARFPKFDIPYESVIHKELSNVVYVSQPVGKRCYLWFTYHQDKPVCFVIDHSTIYLIAASFHASLSAGFGTVLYGTMMNKKGIQCFLMDDMFLFQGTKLTCDYASKLDLFNTLFTKYVCNSVSLKSQVLIMLPEMSMTPNRKQPSYKVYNVRIINLQGSTKYYKLKSQNRVFTVKPTIKSDIYELHEYGKFHSFACIDTYKQSVMMNDLFRVVNENHNLDLIEESDSEEDFENTDPSKYILDKEYTMECCWNKKFNKWSPLSVKK
jgi:hypothetical protein